MMVPHSVTHESVSIVYKGETYMIKAGDPNFEAAREAVFRQDWEAIPPLVSRGLALEKWSNGAFNFKQGAIRYGETALPIDLGDKILALVQEGTEGVSAFLNFWRKCLRNPSENSRKQMFKFVNQVGIPITDDGMILAYKAVRHDYFDKHSGTIKYTIGEYAEMPRGEVIEDPTRACGPGLHAGTKEYVGATYKQDLWLIVLIDPADVVSVPDDHNSGKMRVCRMMPIGHYGEDLPAHYYGKLDTKAQPKAQPKAETKPKVEPKAEEISDKAIEVVDKVDAHLTQTTEPVTVAASKPAPMKITKVAKAATPKVAPKAEEAKDTKGTQLTLPADPSTKLVSNRTGKEYTLGQLHAMGQPDLVELPIDLLRNYARNHLAIVGASKMQGGREALVDRILKVRPSVLGTAKKK